MSDRVTADDMDKLRHALGINERPRKRWGYRNYYCTDVADPAMARLVAAGWMRKARPASELSDTVFVATREGMRAAGLTDREIAKLEKDR